MKLYVMRHGLTVWNEKRIIQGRSKNRLSKTGKEQVQKAAENLKNAKIDIIISSPLMRTIQTANIVNKYHGVKIFKDDAIIEMDQGLLTGRRADSLSDKERALREQRSKELKMENFHERAEVVKEFMRIIKEKYPYENVLVVTHDCNCCLIDKIIKNITLEECNAIFREIFANPRVSLTTYGDATKADVMSKAEFNKLFKF